jgi:hypothetical protein
MWRYHLEIRELIYFIYFIHPKMENLLLNIPFKKTV